MTDFPAQGVLDPPTLPSWVIEALATLDYGCLVAEIVKEDMRHAFPDHVDDEAFEDLLRASVEANLEELQRLCRGAAGISATSAPREFAIAQAKLESPESTLQFSYRVGISVIWRAMASSIEGRAIADGLEPSEAIAGMNLAVQLLLTFHNQVMQRAAEAHANERASMLASHEQVRQRVLRDLTERDPGMGEDELSAVLRYDVRQHHVGVISQVDPSRIRSIIVQAVPESRLVLESISLPVGPGTVVTWFGRRSPWSRRDKAKLAAGLANSMSRLSMGGSAFGVDGLRQTYRDAQQVEQLRRVSGNEDSVLLFDQVRLDALALTDPAAAARFVADELGLLAANTDESARLRETVAAWLQSGSNVSAAAVLGVHEHTVRNRLRRAEELLGHSVTERRLELQSALRLFPLVSLPA